MKQLIKLFSIFLVIAVLPACGPHYKKRSLSYLQQAPLNYLETKDNVTLEIKKLDKAHTKPLFDGQGRHLLKIGVQPLFMRVTNANNFTYLLNSTNINLNSVNQELIFKELVHGKWPIFTTFCQTTAPIALASLYGVYFVNTVDKGVGFILLPFIVVYCAVVIVSIPFVIGTAIYSSYQTNNQIIDYNQNLLEDLTEKTLHETLKIPSDTTQEFLFFADAKQFKNNFDITLTEKLTQKPLTFNVTL